MSIEIDRREAIQKTLTIAATGLCFASDSFARTTPKLITRKIPKTGEALPVIGMGTWVTFNVGGSKKLMDQRVAILDHFFKSGGAMIDSSPMYGSAQKTVGYALKKLKYPQALFSADKIWTGSTSEGQEQFREMKGLWGISKFDLVQIHNLLNWKEHLKTLLQLKKSGQVRYIGITTSHGRRHPDLLAIMRNEPIDFVQATYNIVDREAESKILPLAKERKIAFIANRPLDGGLLFKRVENKRLPDWAKQFDCENWAQFFLKFVVSHSAATFAIPATSQLAHMKENMGAAYGRLPTEAMRQKMTEYLNS